MNQNEWLFGWVLVFASILLTFLLQFSSCERSDGCVHAWSKWGAVTDNGPRTMWDAGPRYQQARSCEKCGQTQAKAVEFTLEN